MFRFFVDKKDGDKFILNDKTLNHIKTSRVQNKDFLVNYKGVFYQCFLDGKTAIIKKKLEINNEKKQKVFLYQSLINIKRFEWFLQKATELGVDEIIPIISENISIKYDKLENKYERWNEIIKNASEQSFRNNAPKLHDPINFMDAIKNADGDKKIILHEKSNLENSIKNFINKNYEKICVFIGPEGGFTDKEIDESIKYEFQDINLGKRILRSETASLSILSILNIFQ